jgi:DNA-binding LacI/PurR family transcriptional regulator
VPVGVYRFTPFFPQLVQGIDQALYQQECGLLLCDANNSPEMEAERLRVLVQRQVDVPTDVVAVDESQAMNMLIDHVMSAGRPLPDALICANDLIALGAMQQLRWAGIRIPDDISVTPELIIRRSSIPTAGNHHGRD